MAQRAHPYPSEGRVPRAARRPARVPAGGTILRESHELPPPDCARGGERPSLPSERGTQGATPSENFTCFRRAFRLNTSCANHVVLAINPDMKFLCTLLLASFCATALQAVDDYKLGPDSQPHEGVPHGKLISFDWTNSTVYPDTFRQGWVYVPSPVRCLKTGCGNGVSGWPRL